MYFLTKLITMYLQFILRRTNALLSNHLPPKVCLLGLFSDFLHVAFFSFSEKISFCFIRLLVLSYLQMVEVVCCKLTPLQSDLYNHFIHSKNVSCRSSSAIRPFIFQKENLLATTNKNAFLDLFANSKSTKHRLNGQ